jgi:hypothetical protein
VKSCNLKKEERYIQKKIDAGRPEIVLYVALVRGCQRARDVHIANFFLP